MKKLLKGRFHTALYGLINTRKKRKEKNTMTIEEILEMIEDGIGEVLDAQYKGREF